MFGKLHYTPDEFYRMSFPDMTAAIEGYSDEEMKEANRLRHIMWAPLAAMGGKTTPKQLMPLPIDAATERAESMTKEQFLQLAKALKNKGIA